MYDRERLDQLFSDLDRYFSDLDSFSIRGADDLHDKKTFYAVSMLLFAILNHAIDLGQEIVSSKKLGVPSTYRDIFRLLARDGVVDTKLEKELSSLVGYRNLLAHEYDEFDAADLIRVLRSIDSVRLFAGQMKRVIQKELK